MGIRLFSSSSYDTTPVTNNPNPNKFNIIKYYKIKNINSKKDMAIVLVNYPDCNNYEGNKILVYENVNLEKLLKQCSIDPHFSESKKYYSPIARFVPTNKGWDMAVFFATYYG